MHSESQCPLALSLTWSGAGALAALAGGHNRGHATLLGLGNHRGCHALLPPARRPAHTGSGGIDVVIITRSLDKRLQAAMQCHAWHASVHAPRRGSRSAAAPHLPPTAGVDDGKGTAASAAKGCTAAEPSAVPTAVPLSLAQASACSRRHLSGRAAMPPSG